MPSAAARACNPAVCVVGLYDFSSTTWATGRSTRRRAGGVEWLAGVESDDSRAGPRTRLPSWPSLGEPRRLAGLSLVQRGNHGGHRLASGFST